MRKFWGWAAAGVVLLVVIGIGLEPTHVVIGRLRGESFYEGRPTSYWRKAVTGDPAHREQALQSLLSPQAVEVLRELLREPAHSTAENDARMVAVELLGKLGPDAQSATPELLAALQASDELLPPVAAATLPQVGVTARDAVPALAELLDTSAAVAAARAMSRYKAQAKEALPQLIALMIDTTRVPEVRWNAARTIGKIGPEALPAVPALIDTMTDDNATVREHAAEAIGDIGPTAAQAVPALTELLDDADTKVRRDAVRSLGQVGPAATAAVPQIVKLLDDPETIVREAAAKALQAIVPESWPQQPPPTKD